MKEYRAARDGKELTEFHSNSQIVVEVAEESRICRFGEKIRKYEIDIQGSPLTVTPVTVTHYVYLR